MAPDLPFTSAACALVTSDRRFLYASESFVHLCSTPGESLAGRPIADVFTTDSLRAGLEALFERACSGHDASGACELENRLGRRMEVDCRLQALHAPDTSGSEAPLVAWTVSTANPQPSGENPAPHPASRALDEVGRLAGLVAHDLNNVLVGVVGGLDLVRTRLARASVDLGGELDLITRATGRASSLCKSLIAMTGRPPAQPATVDLEDVVARAIEEARRHDDAVPIEVDCGPAKGLRADAFQLRHALSALVANALEAMDGREGAVRVTTRVANEVPAGETYEPSPKRPAAAYQVIEVSDSGSGMTERVRRHAFDPFFTTRELQRGLGLRLVRAVVIGHDGAARIHSAPGEGTTVQLYFPLSEEPDATRPGRLPSLVLIVDDERTVLDSFEGMLRLHGVAVLTAKSGPEALATYRARHAEIDAVLIDVMMPRMNGPETLRQLRQIRPDVPAAFVSASSPAECARVVEPGSAPLFEKPVDAAGLLRCLRLTVRHGAGFGHE